MDKKVVGVWNGQEGLRKAETITRVWGPQVVGMGRNGLPSQDTRKLNKRFISGKCLIRVGWSV